MEKRVLSIIIVSALIFLLLGCNLNKRKLVLSSALQSSHSSVSALSEISHLSYSKTSIKQSSSAASHKSISAVSKSVGKSSSYISSSYSSLTSSSASEIKKPFVIPDFSGKEAQVLILGNSFISTSQIGERLRDLAFEKGEKLNVTAISRGFYSIEKYAADINQFPLIKSGGYDIIFLCGMFSESDLNALNHFIETTSETKTLISLLPADNENDYYYHRSLVEYNMIGHTNWDRALDYLKNNGFSEENLCFDDNYKHTNELGGYVGACLIYSFLYKEKPQSVLTAEKMIREYTYLIPGSTKEEKMNMIKKIEQVSLDVVEGKIV